MVVVMVLVVVLVLMVMAVVEVQVELGLTVSRPRVVAPVAKAGGAPNMWYYGQCVPAVFSGTKRWGRNRHASW